MRGQKRLGGCGRQLLQEECLSARGSVTCFRNREPTVSESSSSQPNGQAGERNQQNLHVGAWITGLPDNMLSMTQRGGGGCQRREPVPLVSQLRVGVFSQKALHPMIEPTKQSQCDSTEPHSQTVNVRAVV